MSKNNDHRFRCCCRNIRSRRVWNPSTRLLISTSSRSFSFDISSKRSAAPHRTALSVQSLMQENKSIACWRFLSRFARRTKPSTPFQCANKCSIVLVKNCCKRASKSVRIRSRRHRESRHRRTAASICSRRTRRANLRCICAARKMSMGQIG